MWPVISRVIRTVKIETPPKEKMPSVSFATLGTHNADVPNYAAHLGAWGSARVAVAWGDGESMHKFGRRPRRNPGFWNLTSYALSEDDHRFPGFPVWLTPYPEGPAPPGCFIVAIT